MEIICPFDFSYISYNRDFCISFYTIFLSFYRMISMMNTLKKWFLFRLWTKTIPSFLLLMIQMKMVNFRNLLKRTEYWIKRCIYSSTRSLLIDRRCVSSGYWNLGLCYLIDGLYLLAVRWILLYLAFLFLCDLINCVCI